MAYKSDIARGIMKMSWIWICIAFACGVGGLSCVAALSMDGRSFTSRKTFIIFVIATFLLVAAIMAGNKYEFAIRHTYQ